MRPTIERESERKYDVPAGAALPDWSRAPSVASVRGPERHELDARYFDTADLRLLGAGFTLRKRLGGDDEGWHAKVPAGGGDREELRLPLQDDLPAALADLFLGITRGADVVEVARLRTTRTTWTLLDAGGAPLAEVAADQVTATAGDDEQAWHEVEIELARGADPATADHLGAVMAGAGFAVASSKSKIARALGGGPGLSPTDDVVVAYLREQAKLLRLQDVALRRGLPDAVHQTRLACRKLRATLKSFGRQAGPLRADLQWYTRKLGEARDVEVLAGAVRADLAELPVEQVLGPVSASLTAHFAREEATAADTVVRTMASERYVRMLDRLDELLREDTGGQSKPELRKAIAKAWHRVERAVHAAGSTAEGPGLDEALHRVRKEVRKARYAADAALPAFGKRLRSWRSHLKALQDALGEQHDAVVACARLRQLAIRECGHGRNTYTYGVLYGRQDERRRAARRRYHDLWTTPPAKPPRWL